MLRWECDKCYRHVSGDLERSCVPKDIKRDPKGQWSGQPPVCESEYLVWSCNHSNTTLYGYVT